MDPPKSIYEANERRGRITGLPSGYTYGPSPLIELKKVTKITELPVPKEIAHEIANSTSGSSSEYNGESDGVLKSLNAGPPRRISSITQLQSQKIAGSSSFNGRDSRSFVSAGLKSVRGSMSDLKGRVKETPESHEEEILPEGMTLIPSKLPSKRIPNGFLNVSPFSGFNLN
jgi:hypothetical protein